ncbi:MAG: Na+/H+ antiporter subunit E [Verrucomicrobia bacterium]|nr:Na+/H+ antiporter subunit E [Verrucomicrobiota bacterium]
MLGWNILIAVVWMALTGTFDVPNALLGLGLGFMILLFTGAGGATKVPSYHRRFFKSVLLLIYFICEVVKSNFIVAWEVLTPGCGIVPGIVAVPLDAETDFEISLLGAMITLTPGTLTVDVSPDRKYIYVHAMYLDPDNVAEFVMQIKNSFERRILEITR